VLLRVTHQARFPDGDTSEIYPELLRTVEIAIPGQSAWPVSAEVGDPLAKDPAYRPTQLATLATDLHGLARVILEMPIS
jgi:hypothetical protein